MNSNVGTAFQPPSESLAKMESFDLFDCTTMELDCYCLSTYCTQVGPGWLLMVLFNQYKPSILFVGHMQTVQIQIRCCRMQHLTRVSTICLQNVLLKFE